MDSIAAAGMAAAALSSRSPLLQLQPQHQALNCCGVENVDPLSLLSSGIEVYCGDELQRRSPLPTWYPRRPLQDITAVLNAQRVVLPTASDDALKNKKNKNKRPTPLRIVCEAESRQMRKRRQVGSQQSTLKKIQTPSPSSSSSSSLLKGFR